MTKFIRKTYDLNDATVDNWFWKIDMHCNKEGYQVFAESLNNFVLDLEKLDTLNYDHADLRR